MTVVTYLPPRITAITASETSSVAPLVSGMFSIVFQNFSSVPPVPSLTPSIPATCPIATWMPTPVRKPINTVRERKSARKPSRTSRARIRKAAVISATRPARATYWSDAVAAMPARPAARIAALAESAPTTRWREEPKSA